MTHRSWFQSQNSLQLPTNLNKRIVCELKKGEKIIKNNCNDLTNFFVCFLHIISYKNVWDLSKKIVKTSWTFFVKIEVLTQIVRIIWCNLWYHIKHCAYEETWPILFTTFSQLLGQPCHLKTPYSNATTIWSSQTQQWFTAFKYSKPQLHDFW